MSGIKNFSKLSKEELIKRMSHISCYKCEMFVEFDKHWSCQECVCVCCDSCVEEGDVNNEELEEDCGFICKECRPKYKKEKEEDNTCEECGVEDDDVFVHPFGCVKLCNDCGKDQCPLEKHGKNTEDHCEVCHPESESEE